MNFVQNIFNNPQSNFDPLNFIGIIVTVLASVYIFKVETSVSLLKEQYEKLFFPLFNVLEPILFQGPDENILACALKIIENNKQLADGKLISLYYYYLQNPTKKNFTDLCTYVDKAYDRSCRKLGLKLRPMQYRIYRHQYKNPLYVIVFLSAHILLLIFAIFSMFIVSALAIALTVEIYNALGSETQLIFVLSICILALAIWKYIFKKL